jgi:predicted nucleic acid-binding protein
VIIVDTNIITYLFIEGEHTANAEKALRKDRDWAAPLLWRSEFRNVLSFYIRQKHLAFDRAAKLMNEAMYLLSDNEYDVSSLEVLRLSDLSGCSAYDCEFIALAKDLGVLLITLDKKIIKAFPDHTVSLNVYVK